MNIEISPKEFEKKLNWHDGILYCSILTIDGKDDWRMPTKDELNDIYKNGNDFDRCFYWAFTEFDCDEAWTQSFWSGVQGIINKKENNWVIPVRDV